MNKIKIFTNHYYPENFRINDISRSLSDYEVSVVTQTPNYPKGNFFPSYGIFKRRKECVEGVGVRRLPVIPRGHNSIMLAFNYLSYIVSSFFYARFTKEKSDHVLVYITSPIFISWAGLKYAQRNKVKSSLYLLDLWPGSLIAMLNIKNKRIIRSLEKMCIKIYNRFDNIVVSSYGFIEVLESYGIDKNKIHYLPQHAEEKPKNKLSYNFDSKVSRVVFTGNIGEAQGLDVLLDVAELLQENNNSNIHFEIVGDGRYKETLENKISSKNLKSYFSFRGQVAKEEIPSILERNHFGFVSLADEDIFNRTLPAKVQSYMSYGIPLLASANGEIPWIINKAKCGFSAPAGNAKELYQVLLRANQATVEELEEMSENGYNYSASHFDKDILVEKLIKIMKEGN